MKILRLTLHNLASLAGTQAIDFEREPLRSTGLFAISGPTGSGKSTLLDALCLALYENTPRLTAASGTKLPDVGGEEITQKAPANLLRRGAAEGFAEVAFVGVDGGTYTARWSVRRAHQRVDGSLQKTEVALYRGNVRDGKGSLIEGVRTKPEVLDAIAKKIGLSFEQFTRAVLLAQNDFAVFLKSDDRERAEILQALTGTERFERISVAVFERDKQERGAIEALEATAKGQLPLPPEERAKADGALAAAVAVVERVKAAAAARESQLSWFQRDRDLATQLQTARTALERAAKDVADAAPRRAELREVEEISREARSLHDAESVAAEQHATAMEAVNKSAQRVTDQRTKAELARSTHARELTSEAAARQMLAEAAEPLARARGLDAQLEPATARRNEKQQERIAAEKLVQQQTDRATELNKAMVQRTKRQTALQQEREPIAWIAPVVADLSAWTQRLQTVIALRDDVVRGQGEVASKQKAEAKTTAAVEAAREQETRTRAVSLQKDDVWTTAEQAVKAFDPEALALERGRLEARLANLNTARTTLTSVEELRVQTDAATKVIQHLQQQARELTDKVRANRDELPRREARLEGSRASRVLAEATVAEQTGLLREKLRPSEPCPVCGATEHPYAAHVPIVDAVLSRLRDDEREAERLLTTLRQQIAADEASLASFHKQEETKTAERRALQDKSVRATEQLASALAAIELNAVAENERAAALERAQGDAEGARTRLADTERRHRAANKALADATKARDLARAALITATEATATMQTALATAKAEREAAQAALGRTEAACRAAETELNAFFALLGQAAETRFRSGAVPFAQEFARAGEALRRVDRELTELTAELAKVAIETTEVGKTLNANRQSLEGRRTEEKAAETAFETLRKDRAALLGGRAVEAVERELNDAAKTARVRLDAAVAILAEAEKAVTAAATELRETEKRVSGAADVKTRTRAALDDWLTAYAVRTGRGVDRTRLVEVLRRGVSWIETERAALAALENAANATRGAVAAHEQQQAAHAQARPTAEDETVVTDALKTCRGELSDAEARHLEARTVVAADDQRRKEHASLEAQIEERRRKAAPWFQLNELIGSADGAKFRGIVQGRTLDLLLGYANAQLDLLSARYRLERLTRSLNLVVVDRDMADERRSVHTLSGGESFLVSLALALGLASLTSNRIRIESLFIDEGFGSLDPATLNTAMNALMHLEAQGRKVGVISHVTEMADAIPVQIKVVKGASGASRVVVPGAPQVCDDPAPEGPEEKPSPASIAETAAKIIAILERSGRVSKVALRRELGCTHDELDLACDHLGPRLQFEGRSLRLI